MPGPATGGSGSSSPHGLLLPTPSATLGSNGGLVTPAKAREGGTLIETLSMLPTPQASDHKGPTVSVGRVRRDGRARTAADADLPEAVSLLKTPTAQLAVNGGSQHPDKRRAGGHGPTLADQAEHELLPTPVASYSQNTPENHLRKKPGRTSVTDLRIMVENDMMGTGGSLLPTPAAADGERRSLAYKRGNPTLAGALLPTPQVADVTGGHRNRSGARSGELLLPGLAEHLGSGPVVDWGKYSRAVLRWQQVTGRMVPHPLEPGSKGNRVLAPVFVEWMLGLPEGWVTGVDGLSRNAQLKILGNGVVPRQAVLALLILLERLPWNATN
jgi:DNA (cytosine-5)-methyltransferase 1